MVKKKVGFVDWGMLDLSEVDFGWNIAFFRFIFVLPAL